MTERLTIKAQSGLIHLVDDSESGVNQAIKNLYEYETVEEEGRLVALPCKPCDKVYQLFVTDIIGKKLIYKIFQSEVIKIIIDRFRIIFSFETLDENKYKSELTIESCGKTVVMTREAAV